MRRRPWDRLGPVDNWGDFLGRRGVIQALLWLSGGRMDRDRFGVSDAVWAKIARLLPGKASDRGVTARDNRLFVEAVLWRVRTGLPWRDLPDAFGNWNSVFQRFRRWVRAGVFERIFECLSGDPDFEYVLIDGTIVTAHQKASGAKGGLSIRPSDARAAD